MKRSATMSSLFALLFMGLTLYLIFHGNQRNVRRQIYTDILNGMLEVCDESLEWCTRMREIDALAFFTKRAVWRNQVETAAAWHEYFSASLARNKAIVELEERYRIKKDAVDGAMRVIGGHFGYTGQDEAE